MLKFVEDINNLSVGTVLNEYEDALNNVGNEMHPKASFKSLMQALRHGLIWNHIDEDKT